MKSSTLGPRGWLAVVVLWVALASPLCAQQADFPPVGAPGFKEVCVAMYDARAAGADWPSAPKGDGRFCTIGTGGARATAMTADDYTWALRKSLTFACKGKREVLYEVMRRLRDCDGTSRTLQMIPAKGGACRVRFAETGESFEIAPPLIGDLVDWRENMPWYERVLVDLFAPGELPMVMDGLIACGARASG